ncbi:MAG: membrane protein insertase YidC [Flavobacteriales bacterium]
MDRNSTIGLVLIGLIITVFSVMNQPSEAEIKAEQKKEAAAAQKAQKQKAENKKVAKQSPTSSTSIAQTKSTQKEVISTLENEELRIELNSKGGILAGVYLKNYRNYKDFAAKKDNALCLFENGSAHNQLVLSTAKGKIYTKDYFFDLVKSTKTSAVYEAKFAEGTIRQIYKLKKGHDLSYKIVVLDNKGFILDNTVLNWAADFKKTERLFSEQRRVSTICYNQTESGLDYLSETASESGVAEEDIEWVAFKQSYFSAILHPANAFPKKGTKFFIQNFKEGHPQAWTHLKGYHATMALDFQNNAASFNWFFGPNDYEVLKSYNSGYDDILNFGWGLFRWINIYAVQPIFNLLVDNGIALGWAILILTLILKTILMPVQWKMFVSSVKMRILKPEIDELNAKYPKQEDAMKKQMEMMTLYRESGASPLAGCLPMLIQMPILLAVFRFFPAAFELRQKGFLWAEDLSSFDSILDFSFHIPFYGDHISLFTLLMAGTTLAYTYMNSGNMQTPQQPGMPDMRIIMYIFPFMMIFFFNNYSAGLSYYYFISTLMSIVMMVLIKRFFVNEDKLKLKMAERKANNAANPKVKKKSRFQEKLEEMQRQQQEMLKNRKK